MHMKVWTRVRVGVATRDDHSTFFYPHRRLQLQSTLELIKNIEDGRLIEMMYHQSSKLVGGKENAIRSIKYLDVNRNSRCKREHEMNHQHLLLIVELA
jgi:hypothetical protein